MFQLKFLSFVIRWIANFEHSIFIIETHHQNQYQFTLFTFMANEGISIMHNWILIWTSQIPEVGSDCMEETSFIIFIWFIYKYFDSPQLIISLHTVHIQRYEWVIHMLIQVYPKSIIMIVIFTKLLQILSPNNLRKPVCKPTYFSTFRTMYYHFDHKIWFRISSNFNEIVSIQSTFFTFGVLDGIVLIIWQLITMSTSIDLTIQIQWNIQLTLHSLVATKLWYLNLHIIYFTITSQTKLEVLKVPFLQVLPHFLVFIYPNINVFLFNAQFIIHFLLSFIH